MDPEPEVDHSYHCSDEFRKAEDVVTDLSGRSQEQM
jgi:hypothetical protein